MELKLHDGSEFFMTGPTLDVNLDQLQCCLDVGVLFGEAGGSLMSQTKNFCRVRHVALLAREADLHISFVYHFKVQVIDDTPEFIDNVSILHEPDTTDSWLVQFVGDFRKR